VSLEARSLSFDYDGRPVLTDISFSAAGGELVAVLGPNGVGKSTLFRCLLGFLTPGSGEILLDGKPLRKLSRKEAARRIAYIPQSASPAFNYTVLDTVLMGLANRMGPFQSPGPAQAEKAVAVLEALGIAHLRHRALSRISGGERQLTLLGRALVQDARILIMDEPTANLDYGNQYRVMERAENLAGQGYTVILSTHDPNLAFLHAGRVLALKEGRLLCDGKPETVLTEATLSALYGIGVSLRRVKTEYGEVTVSIPGSLR
jgi:iron complex transport system ATP-binding protein